MKNLLCISGFHRWKNIEKNTPIPKKGESIIFSNLHRCQRCGKYEQKSMGMII